MARPREPHLYIRIAQTHDEIAQKVGSRERSIESRKVAFALRRKARRRVRSGEYDRPG